MAFLTVVGNGGERQERRSRSRFFLKIPKLGVISDTTQKILHNYL